MFPGRFLHHIILGVIIGFVLAASYVTAGSSSSSSPRIIWMTSPVTITFSHNIGHGNATVEFKCAPPLASAVVLTTSVTPTAASLSVSPSGFAKCGPAFTSVTLNAESNVPGTYHGVVTISQLSLYRTIQPSLSVTIVVE